MSVAEISQGARVGVDIGGTFTDIVLLKADGSLATRKIPSTVDDYARAIAVGIEELLRETLVPSSAISDVRHGTTVATNALLEGKGARTALVTTEGFRDVLELRRIRIPALYDLAYRKPPPLVPRRRRYEVVERVDPRGRVLTELDPASVATAIEDIGTAGADAVAVCLLHSYANPAHEHAVAEEIRERLPDVYVTCSADILPEIREYERTSTAVINSYVGPLVKTYLRRLRERLLRLGISSPLLVMQSNGGVMTADIASEMPAQIVESGPAAGVIASAKLARLAGYDNVITFDMGGTTAKAATIERGAIALTSDYEVGAGINTSSLLVSGGGYALKLPAIDISEVGAGGGSIVRIDVGGRLHVGPDSAGAHPGPVCYDAGGTLTTVTDANAVLGFINPRFIAGGRVALDTARAREALEEQVAQPLGLSALDAAYGVHAVASANMVRAVKAVTTYRGRDPRDFVLFAFGGSGPIHAASMARLLGIRQVVVPPAAGLFSAFGLLFSDVQHQRVRTFLKPAAPECLARLNSEVDDLTQSARDVLVREGYDVSRIVVERSADLRYAGQGFELNVPLAAGELTAAELDALIEEFGDEHLRTYGHRTTDEPVEIVNLRAAARVVPAAGETYDPQAVSRIRTDASATTRDAFFGPDFGLLETRVVSRNVVPTTRTEGPMIVEEYDATCVVPPDFSVRVDEWGNLILEAVSQ